MTSKIKTWQKELAVVIAILSANNVYFGKSWVEWIGTAAVVFTFMCTQLTFRAVEAMESGEILPCKNWMHVYSVIKEILWLFYFFMLGATSAQIGVIIFLSYVPYRAWYKNRA